MPMRAPSRDELARMEPQDAKAEIRAYVRAHRESRSDKARTTAADALAAHVLEMPEVEAAACVSVYASRPAEPGTLPLIEQLAERGTRVLVPLLGGGLQRGWAEYSAGLGFAALAPGRPPEPVGDFLPFESLVEADVVVVPALGVDQTGTRLGQGGGWYDRALPEAREGALFVALAFADEVHGAEDPLPREWHDVPVHCAITPDGRLELGAS